MEIEAQIKETKDSLEQDDIEIITDSMKKLNSVVSKIYENIKQGGSNDSEESNNNNEEQSSSNEDDKNENK